MLMVLRLVVVVVSASFDRHALRATKLGEEEDEADAFCQVAYNPHRVADDLDPTFFHGLPPSVVL
jgi:hypothetical protein